MTAFGWNDSGGGTTVPRLAAKELARRGWEVTVFHAAVKPTESKQPYEVVEWEEDGVRLIGVHNRPHGLFDLGNPDREIDDPPISAAFEHALEQVRPDVVHFHNLHNLGASLIDQVAARGVPAYFTTHNYWLDLPPRLPAQRQGRDLRRAGGRQRLRRVRRQPRRRRRTGAGSPRSAPAPSAASPRSCRCPTRSGAP